MTQELTTFVYPKEIDYEKLKRVNQVLRECYDALIDIEGQIGEAMCTEDGKNDFYAGYLSSDLDRAIKLLISLDMNITDEIKQHEFEEEQKRPYSRYQTGNRY
jgi:hypothetical protein